ncbi:glycosyltransferase [Changchengzhania lutea]|uniref:glycosyltransferase n=1 Tax=Changchengzhania lutea TaxID=2049305 RepID=UPI00115E0D97|nr:glycosyltransferase [Changchengzhania lutea]
MKLSIIIPVYNVEQYLARCLDSILNQNMLSKDYEILIIDDGSQDNTIEIANTYAKKHTQILVYSKTNGGVGSARNKGIELSRGTYLYFIDPDDYIAFYTLNTIISHAFQFDLDILTFNSISTTPADRIDSSVSKIKNFDLTTQTGIEYIAQNGYKNEVWWYVIKKDFLKEKGIQFIEGRWMEDAIFTTELFIKATHIAHIPYDVHRHVKTPESAMTSKEPSHYLRVIRDNANAAVVFKPLISDIDLKSTVNQMCVQRLKARQQSFVFFLMIRMLQSTLKFPEVKLIIEQVSKAGAYPLNSFLGTDYNSKIYYILVRLFNNKNLFYFIFIISNPILKMKNPIKKASYNHTISSRI